MATKKEEQERKMREVQEMLNDFQDGDVFRVVRGRKYPHGTEFVYKSSYIIDPTKWGRFAHDGEPIPMLLGYDDIKVSLANCEFVGRYKK